MFAKTPTPTMNINWNKGWMNSPTILLTGIKVPKWPDADDPIWQRTPDGMHLARKGPFAFYFFTDGKPTHGYGGRTFEGTLTNGEKFSYRGAWSSRAGCVNAAISDGQLSGDYIVDVVINSCYTAVCTGFLEKDVTWNVHEYVGLSYKYRDESEFTYEPTVNGYFKGDEGFEYPDE